MRRIAPVFLLIAVAGAALPLPYFIAWFTENGWSLPGIVDAWTVNAATEGMLWDLTVSAVAVTVATLAHAVARRDPWALIAIPATFGIGVSCGLPLLLWFIARRS